MQHSGYSYTSTSENSAEAKFAELVFHALRGGDPNIRGGATTAWVPLPGVAAHPTPQPSRSPRSRGLLVESIGALSVKNGSAQWKITPAQRMPRWDSGSVIPTKCTAKRGIL